MKKIKVTICSHQADNPRYVWPDVWLVISKFRKSMAYMTECPYWDQVSLNNPNPNPNSTYVDHLFNTCATVQFYIENETRPRYARNFRGLTLYIRYNRLQCFITSFWYSALRDWCASKKHSNKINEGLCSYTTCSGRAIFHVYALFTTRRMNCDTSRK